MSNPNRSLSAKEKRIISILGIPSFGLALSVTVIVTYVPVLAQHFTKSTTVVGLLIAAEGIVALTLPIIAGGLSDHLHTRLGGRLPFLIGGLPLAVGALALVGFAHSLTEIVIGIVVFFAGYYIMYEPYRALYPDVVPVDVSGRAQSVQGVWRGIGTAVALIVGSLLLVFSDWLPFVVSAGLVTISTLGFLYLLLHNYGVPKQRHEEFSSIKESYLSAFILLRRDKPLRGFMVANMLWELTLAALKSFVLLYMTVGLGRSKLEANIFITIGAVVMFLGAAVGIKVADKFDKIQLVRIASLVFGLGMLMPAFTTTPWLIILILPITAFGGAVVLTLPYSLLIPLMPSDRHGQFTGLYSASRGIGITLGPLLAGVAISLTKHSFVAKGYSATWLVGGLAMLLSLIPLRNLRAARS